MEYWLFGSFITAISIIVIDIIKNKIKKRQYPMSIKEWAYWLIGGVIAFVAAYAGIIIWLTWPISEYSIGQSGVFGDSFGVLTALFSGLAFSGLIITILLQREDLKLQRDDLKLQRDELKETREELKFQNFETTFFQMLRLHNSILESIDIKHIKNHTVIASGRDCFSRFYDTLYDLYKPYLFYKTDNDNDKVKEHINKIYMEFWAKNKQDLGHYFRYLYRIFKYVNESFIDEDTKKLYASTIRAQLSDMETALLFYNCLSSHGNEKFKPLVEKYTLFDNLPKELLFEKEHENLYKPSAFITPKNR